MNLVTATKLCIKHKLLPFYWWKSIEATWSLTHWTLVIEEFNSSKLSYTGPLQLISWQGWSTELREKAIDLCWLSEHLEAFSVRNATRPDPESGQYVLSLTIDHSLFVWLMLLHWHECIMTLHKSYQNQFDNSNVNKYIWEVTPYISASNANHQGISSPENVKNTNFQALAICLKAVYQARAR